MLSRKRFRRIMALSAGTARTTRTVWALRSPEEMFLHRRRERRELSYDPTLADFRGDPDWAKIDVMTAGCVDSYVRIANRDGLVAICFKRKRRPDGCRGSSLGCPVGGGNRGSRSSSRQRAMAASADRADCWPAAVPAVDSWWRRAVQPPIPVDEMRSSEGSVSAEPRTLPVSG